jgi:hypothetical protein
LDTEIREDYVKFFDWLKERVVFNARKHKRDLNFQFSPRSSGSSKHTKGFNKKGQKRLKPAHQAPLLLGRSKEIRGSRRIRAEVMPQDASNVEVRII